MSVAWKIEAQLGGDYATLVKAKSPVAFWRLGDREGYAQAVLSDAPVAYWQLGEASGPVADMVNGNTGTVTAGTYRRPGALANGTCGLGLNGTSSQIAVADHATLHVGDTCSFECWIKRSSVGLGSARVLVEGFANSLELTIETDDKITVAKNGVGPIVKSTVAISDTTAFHHIVYAKAGATSRIWIDGVDVSGAITNQTLANVNSIEFGSTSAASFFPGDMDEIAYYGYALTAQQVANHYALRTSTIATVAAATVADSSGGGYTGTVRSAVSLSQAAQQPDGNKAAAFDGTTAGGISIAIPPPTSSTPSVEAWFYQTASVNLALWSFGYVWGSGGAISFPFELSLHGTTGLSVFLNFTTLTPGWTDIGFVPALNTWYHVVSTWDGTWARVYVNGAQVWSSNAWAGRTLINSGSSAGKRSIGVQDAGAGFAQPFPGRLDEVAYYSYALTPAQVMENYLAGYWTDLTADRAHPGDAPITLYGGIDSTGRPGDVLATPGLWTFALDNSAHNSLGTRGAYSLNGATRRAGWSDGIRCRFSVTIGANPPFYKFPGWIEDIIPVAGLYENQTVQVIVSDWLGQAAAALAAGVAAQAAKTGDQLTASLVALVAQPPYGTSYDAGSDTYTYGLDDLARTSMVSQGLANVAKSGLDRIYLKGDTATGGVLRFESHTFRRTYTADAFVLTDTAPGGQPGLALVDIRVARRRADRLNKIRFTVKPRKADGANVVLYAENIDAGTAVAIPAVGGSITIWADYADPAQLAQQVAIVPASGVAPVATTDYLLNSLANGTGTNLTASCTVVATFFGNTAKIVITNNHATLPAFRTLLQLRGKGIYAYQSVTLESSNSANAQLFGERLAADDMPYQSSILTAQAAADYYKDLTLSEAWTPVDALTASVPASDEATLWTLLNAETSTPFAVSETVSGLALYPMWINKWQLEIDERDNVTFTFVPEPRDPNQYWSLGVSGLSELGSTTYFAPF